MWFFVIYWWFCDFIIFFSVLILRFFRVFLFSVLANFFKFTFLRFFFFRLSDFAIFFYRLDDCKWDICGDFRILWRVLSKRSAKRDLLSFIFFVKTYSWLCNYTRAYFVIRFVHLGECKHQIWNVTLCNYSKKEFWKAVLKVYYNRVAIPGFQISRNLEVCWFQPILCLGNQLISAGLLV